ncbi:MAG: glycosyltransferase family 9 protein [Candidatus Wallbacteria bacterium]|nr:glycosyltransferase family 9 protein [Candidatus Wallbacteria bacterium]
MEKSLLFLLPSNIGDLVLATPVMRHLFNIMPGAVWDLYGGQAALALIEKHSCVRHVLYSADFDDAKGKLALYWKLRQYEYAVIADMRKTALPFLLPADKKYWRFRKGRCHAVYDFFAVLGPDRPARFPGFLIATEESDRLAALDILTECRISRSPLLIGLNPDANWEKKRWPSEFWPELVRLIKSSFPEAVFLVTGGKKRVDFGMKDVFDYSGKLSLRQTAELLSMAHLFISNDSGPMHIAAALGTPTLGIFGPSQPQRYAPFGRKHEFYQNRALCSTCMTVNCDKDFWCLKHTYPEKIAELALGMLSQGRS